MTRCGMIRCSRVPVVRSERLIRRWRHGLPFALTFVWLAILATPAFAQQIPIKPTFNPAPGKTFVYKVGSTGEVGLDYQEWARAFSQNGGAAPDSKLGLTKHLYSVEADLHLRHLGLEGGLRRMAGKLQNVVYLVDGRREFFAKLFEAPFILSYREDGSLASMKLPAALPEEIGGVIRSLVEPMQVVLPAEHALNWQGRQTDSQSRSVLAYNVTKTDEATRTVHIERRLLEQRQNDNSFFNTSHTGPVGDETVVLGSGGEIVWSQSDNALLGMRIEDRTASHHDGKAFAEQVSRFEATLTTTWSPLSLPSTLEEGRRFLDDRQMLRLTHYWVPVSVKQKVAPLVLSDVLMRIERNEMIEGMKPGAALMFLVRLKPEHAREVTLHYGRTPASKENAETVGRAFASVAAAGHFEAQQALSEVLSDPSFSPLARDRAIRALLSVQMPYPFLLPVVWSYRESLPREGGNWRVNLSIVTNIYGALGGANDIAPETTNEVTRVLGQRLQTTRDIDEKLMCLTALGNVGDLAKVLPLTAPYFSDSDPDLRRRAFHTYQKAIGEEAFAEFAARYETETDLDVRRTASGIADLMPPSQARNQWAARQVFTTADTLIRDRLVQMLGNGLRRYPENENTLRELLNVETDREVRSTIYRYVPPNVLPE